MENMLKKILEKLQSLEEGQHETRKAVQSLEEGQHETRKAVQSLEEGQHETRKAVQSLEEGQHETRKVVQSCPQPASLSVQRPTALTCHLMDGHPHRRWPFMVCLSSCRR